MSIDPPKAEWNRLGLGASLFELRPHTSLSRFKMDRIP